MIPDALTARHACTPGRSVEQMTYPERMIRAARIYDRMSAHGTAHSLIIRTISEQLKMTIYSVHQAIREAR